MRLTGTFCLLAWACDPARGLDKDLRAAVAGCSEARDWEICAVEAARLSDLSGDALTPLCQKVAEADVRDLCLEAAVRKAAPAELCAGIAGARIAESCWLEAADIATRRGQVHNIDQAIEGCARTGAIRRHCLLHIVWARSALWRVEGLGMLDAELSTLLAAGPELRSFDEAGYTVGTLARALGVLPGAALPCDRFDEGPAASACGRGLGGQKF